MGSSAAACPKGAIAMIGLSSALFPSTFSQLEVHVGPAKFFINGAVLVIAPTVIFLAPNSTTFIYLDFSGGTVGINESGYPSDDLPICTAITDDEQVASLTDDRPDFTNGISSAVSPDFSDAETPSGAINGTNTTFELLNSPNPPASLFLTLNGNVQTEGVDYLLTSQTIDFVNPPVTGDTLLAWYRY
jgi:hypothetical protein